MQRLSGARLGQPFSFVIHESFDNLRRILYFLSHEN